MKRRTETYSRSHQWIKDLENDAKIHGFYLAKAKRQGLTKKGAPFLSITLGDRTGEIEAKVWDNAEALSTHFKESDIVEIEGMTRSYNNQIQIIVSKIASTETSVDPTLFLEESPKDIGEMMGLLRGVLKKIGNVHLRTVVDCFLADKQFISLFKKAPAAKNFHHGYLGGLLEHTLSVCQMAREVAGHYPDLDQDLMITGAFLHDIGKIREFKFDRMIDYSDEGRLLGHLILGVSMLDDKLGSIKDFPDDLALRLKHLILSHHGQNEFGSPKRPKFLEAFALHLIDDLDAKIAGLRRFMEKDRHEGTWTDYHRLFDRYLLKGKMSVVEETGEPLPSGEERQKALFSLFLA
ncbi:MAG: HD domain-containing protein [Deltaproteobacteria bacterium]|nr:HD domain-containing protein [Deltaproteobacteria bacterium]